MATETDAILQALMEKIAETAQFSVIAISNDVDGNILTEAYKEVKTQLDSHVDMGLIPEKYRDIVSDLIPTIAQHFPQSEEDCDSLLDDMTDEIEEEEDDEIETKVPELDDEEMKELTRD